MSDSVKFTYKDEIDTLFVNDNGKIKSYKMDTIHNQQDKIFKYIIKSISELDGDEPEPGKGLTFTLKAAVMTSNDGLELRPIDVDSIITSGQFIDLVEGDTYTVVYNGVTYSNQVVSSYDLEGMGVRMICLGNFESVMLRSNFASSLPNSITETFTDTELPFALIQMSALNSLGGGGNDLVTGSTISAVFLNNNLNQTITVTRNSDSGNYTLTFTPGDPSKSTLGLCPVIPRCFIIPFTEEDLQSFMNEYGVEDQAHSIVTVDGTKYDCTWHVLRDQEIGLIPSDIPIQGSNPEESPFMIDIMNDEEGGHRFLGILSFMDLDKDSTVTISKE